MKCMKFRKMQSIINKLPEVIKCIIFDYVNNKLNYHIELYSDKFIGNPIELYHNYIIKNLENFYHINKLTKIKTPLQFIRLQCHGKGNVFLKEKEIPQEILNKLQKLSIDCNYVPNLPCVKELILSGEYIEIPIFKGLLKLYIFSEQLKKIPNIVGLKILDCSECYNLTKISHIVGLLELNCSNCENLTEIPNIKGLLELYCTYCDLIEIPNIIGLQKLNCSNCRKLTEIPNIIGLKELKCQNCHNLIEIPNIIGLKELDCYNCYNLIKFPHIIGLLKLECGGCSDEIDEISENVYKLTPISW